MSPCHIFDSPAGRTIACGPKPRRVRCSVCGELGATKLCDFPKEASHPTMVRTCDKPLCTKCAVHCEPDLDYCPTHPAPQGVAP